MRRTVVWWLALALLLLPGGLAQRTVAQAQENDGLAVVQLRPNFYVIAGAGGPPPLRWPPRAGS